MIICIYLNHIKIPNVIIQERIQNATTNIKSIHVLKTNYSDQPDSNAGAVKLPQS